MGATDQMRVLNQKSGDLLQLSTHLFQPLISCKDSREYQLAHREFDSSN